MPVRLRFAIHGKRNNRIFHLVAIDQRLRRNAQPIELLGIYTPSLKRYAKEKVMSWSAERIKYWLSVGAQPSESVLGLLTAGGVVEPNSKWHTKRSPPAYPPPPTAQAAAETNTEPA